MGEAELAAGRLAITFGRVNAHQLIDQIKALPAEEQAKVIDFLEEVKAALNGRYADTKSFADAADWVFAEHAELMHKLSQ